MIDAGPDQGQVTFKNSDRLVTPVLQNRLFDLVRFRTDGRTWGSPFFTAALFCLLDDRDDFVPFSVRCDRVGCGCITIRPETPTSVRTKLHQNSRHFHVAIEDRAVQCARTEFRGVWVH